MHGLHVSILRDARIGDCTNGGVTSPKHGAVSAILVTDEALWFALALDAADIAQAVARGAVVLRLVRRWAGTPNEYLHAEPIGEAPDCHVGPMAGGNFVFSSDSRFRAVCPYPIPVHDRYESVESHAWARS
jgi:hypothetical protein